MTYPIDNDLHVSTSVPSEGNLERDLPPFLEITPVPKKSLFALFMGWLHRHHQQMVFTVDHHAVLKRCEKESQFHLGFTFMTIMAVNVATLGLLLNSPAVIIGAMLISPLMGPIIAIGFAFPSLEFSFLLRSLGSLVLASLLAIASSAFLVSLSPINDLTTEILARTKPNLFDLLVAFFSGLAGGYSLIRSYHTAVVGVAIATALMPPLSTIGFGLITHQPWVTNGAFMLYITNTAAIAFGVAIMAFWFGFGRMVSIKKLLLQLNIFAAIFLILLDPLLDSFKTITQEVIIKKEVRRVLKNLIEDNLSNLMGVQRVDISTTGEVMVRGVVYVNQVVTNLGILIEQDLELALNRDIKVVINQIPVHNLEDLRDKSVPPPTLLLPSEVANTNPIIDNGTPIEHSTTEISDDLK
ncbi:MAG: DUF389 domain-containing protein [Magnetococcus sp. DMHC-6]